MKTETGAPKYFEAEFIRWYSGMENEKILRAYERWKKENPHDSAILPIGVPTDEEIESEIERWCEEHRAEFQLRMMGAEEVGEHVAKWIRSRLTPLLSAQAAEIEHWQGEAYKAAEECGSTCGKEIAELKSQLSTEQAKGREVAIGFAGWLGENYEAWWEDETWIKKGTKPVTHHYTLAYLYQLYLTSLDKSEGK